MNIVCFGDSITHAHGFAEGDRWPTILYNLLEQWRPGAYQLYNCGIGGDTTANGLDRVETDLLPLLPATVIVEFGFNDCNVPLYTRNPRVSLDEYRRNLQEIHRIVKAHRGRTVFIVNHPTQATGERGHGKPYELYFKKYNTAVRQLALKLKAPAIDLPKMIRARKVDLKTFWSEDGLHLSPHGNHIYAELVAARLKEIL